MAARYPHILAILSASRARCARVWPTTPHSRVSTGHFCLHRVSALGCQAQLAVWRRVLRGRGAASRWNPVHGVREGGARWLGAHGGLCSPGWCLGLLWLPLLVLLWRAHVSARFCLNCGVRPSFFRLHTRTPTEQHGCVLCVVRRGRCEARDCPERV